MKNRSEVNYILWEFVVFSILYISAYVTSRIGFHILAGVILMVTAIIDFIYFRYKTKQLLNFQSIFALSWVGGIGVACLQLSELQNDWDEKTWVCFFLIFILMNGGKYIYDYLLPHGSNDKRMEFNSGICGRRVLHCICFLAIISVLCFSIEALKIGYVPLFSKMPHAYSEFHISGIHYFTISSILIPGLTVVYSKYERVAGKKKFVAVLACNIIAVAIPVLCVSRFQIIFAIGFALVIYEVLYEAITVKGVVILLIVLIPIYVLLTIARNHDASYLNSIFAIKNSRIPIFIAQPYMYVANNFENFNCMVEQIGSHTYGLRMMFPFFALTGLKFLFPQLTSIPIFITKKELTTLTMFYDSYYDFGVIGVCLFALILGIIAGLLTNKVKYSKNPIVVLFYGQIAIYFALSFFTTWFSNPTTWFWLIITSIMYLYIGGGKEELYAV